MDDFPIGAILQPGGLRVDDLVGDFASELIRRGIKVRGLVQRCEPSATGCACAMEVVDLHTGERYRISQRLGAGSESCRVDPSGIAAASQVLRRAMEDGAELVVANRFGTLEKSGRGLADEMLAAMASGLPFLTVVAERHVDAWRTFCGGLGEVVAPTRRGLEDWFRRASAARGLMAAAAE
ncbi:MAG: DUF2478 domain-containing protein [Magnetospirillum sp.]|nr:DUF2478 domain-containing protein [Magnetospirillum sp.]